jgi:hypothetical protein
MHCLCMRRRTWNTIAAKEVAIIDKDEKAGATIMVASTAAGELFGWQMIVDAASHQGLQKFIKKRSDYTVKGGGVHKQLKRGKQSAHGFFKYTRVNEETEKKEVVQCTHCPYFSNGVNVLCAGGDSNHWTVLETLRVWIHVIVWESHKQACEAAGQDPLQSKSIVHIDAYSVHISSAFMKWMRQEYPQLLLVFVPACCTSEMQIADVAYNRPLKHAFSQYHMHRG